MKVRSQFGVFFLAFIFFSLIMCMASYADEPALTLGVETNGITVTLSWNTLSATDNYILYYAPCPYDPTTPVASIPMGSKTVFSADLWSGAAFYAAVAAENQEGVPGFSNVVSFVCNGEPVARNALNPFGSDQALAEYLKKGLNETVDMGKVVPYMVLDNAAGEVVGPVVSTTNIQEKGVDEADTIKTDGKYLYVVPFGNSDYRVPGALVTVAEGEKHGEIGVYEFLSDPPRTAMVNGISLDDHKNKVDGLYLLTERSEGPDLLVTIGGQAHNYWSAWCEPWYWMSGTTEVVLYTVNNPLEIAEKSRLNLDGQLISSRLVGDTLYLVTRYTPSLPDFKPYAVDEGEKEINVQVLKKAGLSELTPKFFVSGQNMGDLVKSDRCFLPPIDDDISAQPSLITVTAVKLSDLENPVSQTIAGPTETVYMSTNALYLATTRYRYDRPVPSPSGGASLLPVVLGSKAPVTTDIHKFILTLEGPQYGGSGSVQGNLGWEEDKKSFRMSDYNGVLRVATSLGDTWDASATTRLSLLRESTDEAYRGELKEISHIEGIGEPGEKLYAVRYVGSRAYLVTFRVTDPLYVLDLSDPENPMIKGELHIDGYSDYLHPIGENMLLGIGKDALPDESSDDFGGRGAWYQGVKLSLFDVSDPGKPFEIEFLVFGKRGTGSDALYDHHSLAYLPPVNGNPARLALPVKLHDRIPSGYSFDPEKPWAYYDWTHTGLYLFDINTGENSSTAGIVRRGEIIAATWENDRDIYSSGSDRAVLLNDDIHYIHGDSIFSDVWVTSD